MKKNKWLCKVGLHKWLKLGQSLNLMNFFRQCRKCEIGENQILGAGTIVYSAKTMKEAWSTGKINNSEAKEIIYGKEQDKINKMGSALKYETTLKVKAKSLK